MQVAVSLFKITHSPHAFFRRIVALYNRMRSYTGGIRGFLQCLLKQDNILRGFRLIVFEISC